MILPAAKALPRTLVVHNSIWHFWYNARWFIDVNSIFRHGYILESNGLYDSCMIWSDYIIQFEFCSVINIHVYKY